MKWIWNFYLYSFFGFLLEVVYARLTRAKKRDRKCRLLLPLCPVYGLGAAVLSALGVGHRQSAVAFSGRRIERDRNRIRRRSLL